MKKKIFLVASPLFLLLIFSLYILSNNKGACANSISCIKDLTGDYKETETNGVFMGQSFVVPTNLSTLAFQDNILGEKSASSKKIFVDLTNQRLYAFEGNNLAYNFLISSGKWGQTPTGDFSIWIKLKYTRMAGGNKNLGTYYNLPNVPFTMYFYNNEIPKSRGFGLHGTYWHSNFGRPMSHGCVNLKTEDAEKLYYWTDPPPSASTTYASEEYPGTPITIYGIAPSE